MLWERSLHSSRTNNGHILSLAVGWTLALLTGRSTIAVAGVFGAGKTRSLTFLLAWLAITTNLKIGVVHKENPASRAITSFSLDEAHTHHFARPVGREEAEANTAETAFDLATHDSAHAIPRAKVVISMFCLVPWIPTPSLVRLAWSWFGWSFTRICLFRHPLPATMALRVTTQAIRRDPPATATNEVATMAHSDLSTGHE